MSLSMMLYLAEVSQHLSTVCLVLAVLCVIIVAAVSMAYIDTSSQYKDKLSRYKTWIIACVFASIFCIGVFCVFPSKQTVYLMIGANIAENAVNAVSDDAKDIMNDIKVVIHNYAEQSKTK